jgi:hypothetical protein
MQLHVEVFSLVPGNASLYLHMLSRGRKVACALHVALSNVVQNRAHLLQNIAMIGPTEAA